MILALPDHTKFRPRDDAESQKTGLKLAFLASTTTADHMGQSKKQYGNPVVRTELKFGKRVQFINWYM